MVWNPRARTLSIIEAADNVLAAAAAAGYRFTLRRVFYALVSMNTIPNTEGAYKSLSNTLSKARWEGYIELDALDDLGRVSSAAPSWRSPADLLLSAAEQYRSDWWRDANPLVEVWTEKAAAAGILEPIAHECGVRFLACRGFSSLTALADAASRWEGREHVIVLYVGDHDPSGMDMDRDLANRLERLVEKMGSETTVEFRRVALTSDQIDLYQLPPQPTKTTDSRARGYTADYDGSWELDALNIDILAGLVRDAVEDLAPDDIEDQRADDEAHRAPLRELAGQVQ